MKIAILSASDVAGMYAATRRNKCLDRFSNILVLYEAAIPFIFFCLLGSFARVITGLVGTPPTTIAHNSLSGLFPFAEAAGAVSAQAAAPRPAIGSGVWAATARAGGIGQAILLKRPSSLPER
jgi:ABC-type dipeptide/oligopeptide/nickel transport system permease component